MKYTLNYNASPTLAAFHASPALVRGIRGPVGSGKSVGCCIELFNKAKNQAPGPDGIRRTRFAVIRNTYTELLSTTIKTWLDWFPEAVFGKMARQPLIIHHVKIEDVEMEVQFLALNRPDDASKLRSLELTGAWINEAKYIEDFDLIRAVLERTGRYPSQRAGGCSWSGLIMDTNPPDNDSWWYQMAEEDRWRWDAEKGRRLKDREIRPDQRWEFFAQPSGLAPNAENLENLRQTPESLKLDLEGRRKQGRTYYENLCMGQSEEYVNVFVHGKYGYIQEGRPVYKTEWNDRVHMAPEPLVPIPGLMIYCGIDASGRNPAAVFGQRTGRGQIRVLDEIIIEDMSAEAASRIIAAHVDEHYRSFQMAYYADPAGGYRSQNSDRTFFDLLALQGLRVVPAETNKVGDRIEAVKAPLSRLVDGQPGLLLSPSCVTLRKGFNGGYYYRRYSTSGAVRHDTVPDKRDNRTADAHDALQYMCLGMGELRAHKQRHRETRMYQAQVDFNV